MNKFEGELEKINIEKEVLNNLPKNNLKNIEKLYSKMAETHKEYVNKNSLILKEIDSRLSLASKINLNAKNDILKITNEIKDIEKILIYFDNIKTSYEKMGLDENINNLRHYYMKDLSLINYNILECIEKFKTVNIFLSPNDFIYNKYVNEYITVFFENIDNLDSQKIKETFENIYWKCPEIIVYIWLNIRYIFFKNEKKIDAYFQDQKSKFEKDDYNFIEKYNSLQKELIVKKNINKDLLINEFLNGNILTKDYTHEKLLVDISTFISKDLYAQLDDKKEEELILEMIKLKDTIEEYKLYTDYKFIIDDIKQIYQNKEKNRKKYFNIKNEINKKERKILALNKNTIFHNSEDKNLAEQTKLILEIKDLYKKLDKYKVYYKIETSINETSTLFDLLTFVVSFYDYIFDCISEKYKDMTDDEINTMIIKLKEALKNPNYNIINNITVNEDKNILYIIKDKYQISSININEDDLDENNLENLIKILKKYEIYYNILKNKIDLDKIDELCEFKKILNEK